MLLVLLLLLSLVLLFPLLRLVLLCSYCPASSPSLSAPTGLLNSARAAMTTQTQDDDCLFLFWGLQNLKDFHHRQMAHWVWMFSDLLSEYQKARSCWPLIAWH